MNRTSTLQSSTVAGDDDQDNVGSKNSRPEDAPFFKFNYTKKSGVLDVIRSEQRDE